MVVAAPDGQRSSGTVPGDAELGAPSQGASHGLRPSLPAVTVFSVFNSLLLPQVSGDVLLKGPALT